MSSLAGIKSRQSLPGALSLNHTLHIWLLTGLCIDLCSCLGDSLSFPHEVNPFHPSNSAQILSRPFPEPSPHPLGTVTGALLSFCLAVTAICNHSHEPALHEPGDSLATPSLREGQPWEQPPPTLPWESPESSSVLAHERSSAQPCGELWKRQSIRGETPRRKQG